MSPQPRAAATPDLAGIAMVAGAAASWGTWSLFLRPANLPATLTTPIVFLVMGLAVLPLTWRGPAPRWDRTAVGLVIANAATDAVNVLAFFAALHYTTVAIAVLTHYLTPILVALAAPRVDRVRVPGAGIAAAVALVGLVIVLEPWRATADGAVVGALLGAASAVFYAANVFIVRRAAARVGASRAASYHSLIAALLLAPFALGQLDALTPASLGYLVCGGATIGGLAGVVFATGLTRIGSARTAILTFLEPIVAVSVGAAVWGETLHPIALFGGSLVLGAGILVTRKAR